MGYPGDEGGAPADSRLDTPAGRESDPREGTTGRGSDPRERTRSGSHRRPAGDSHPGATGSYPGTTEYPGTTGYPATTGSAAGPGHPAPAAGTARYAPAAPRPGTGHGTGRGGRGPARDSEPGRGASRAARELPAVAGGPPSRENAWRRPDPRPGQEIQGGPGSTPASGGSSSRGSLWSTGAFRTAGPGGRGPVRGFPPAPGAPDPVYPPGQFSPWNAPAFRTAGAAGWPGLAAGSGPDRSEPEYSLLAVSDPSADATATQTWAVLDDALLGDWSAAPARSGPDESPALGAGEGTPDGPRGFFEPASGPPAPSGYTAPPGYADQAGTDGYPGENGFSGETGLAVEAGSPGRLEVADRLGYPGGAGYPGKAWDADGGPGHPGDAGYPGPADPSLRTARPGGRLAARQGLRQGTSETQEPDTAAGGTRGSRSAARGRKPRKPRRPPSRARMWLMPLVMMVVVIAGITVAYVQFARGQATPAVPTGRPATASSVASPSLGPWQHITTRADDPEVLSLAELFPPRYMASGTVVRTIQRSGRNCPDTVLGNHLRAALRKAGCTQVLRASYLSAGQKIMATVGVLNLASVTDAEHAGKATGATAFIRQLPAAHGPTRNLMEGTGLEEAQIKGHYLILTWAEFTNLKAPGSAARRAELDTFSRQLVTSTAGISLTSRMVFGKPQIP
jgi:hypothetical protein